jgi:hypothetical protein
MSVLGQELTSQSSIVMSVLCHEQTCGTAQNSGAWGFTCRILPAQQTLRPAPPVSCPCTRVVRTILAPSQCFRGARIHPLTVKFARRLIRASDWRTQLALLYEIKEGFTDQLLLNGF